MSNNGCRCKGGPLIPNENVPQDVILPTIKPLIALSRASSCVGYRPFIASLTSIEIAHSIPHLLPILLTARDAIHSTVEAHFNDTPLLAEFTGLITWLPGSHLGWHSDSDRPYLQQRTHSAVYYLNDDFQGGTFSYYSNSNDDDGGCGDVGGANTPTTTTVPPPTVPKTTKTISPTAGMLLSYNAHLHHCVSPITSGERIAFTMWFTEEINHDENTKILNILHNNNNNTSTLLPPPSTLYAIQPDGTDIRLCRLAMLGFALVIGNGGNDGFTTNNNNGKHTFLVESRQFKDDDAYKVALPSNNNNNDNKMCVYVARHHVDGDNKEKVIVMKEVEFRNVFEALFSVHIYYGNVKRRTCCVHCSNSNDDKGGSCMWVRRAAAGQLKVEECDGDDGDNEMKIVRDEGRRYLDECEVEGKKKMEEWKKAGCLFS